MNNNTEISLNVTFNIILSMIKTILGYVFPLITFPYISRVLNPEHLGEVQYYQSIVNYYIIFSCFGMSYYAIREGGRFIKCKKDFSIFFSEMFLLALIFTSITYIFFILFLVVNRASINILLISILSLSIIFNTLNTEWLYQINDDYFFICKRYIVIQLLFIVLLFVFVKDANDYYIYSIILVGSNGFSAFINFLFIRRHTKLVKIKIKRIARHLKPMSLIFFTTLTTTIYMNIDTTMIGAIRGNTEVALYNAAIKINQILKSLMAAISVVLMSKLSIYASSNKLDDFKKLLYNSYHIILLIFIPIIICLIINSKEVLLLLSGKEYVNATFASRILSINAIFSIIDTILYYQVLIPFNMEKKGLLATSLGAGINIFLNIILIPLYGYNAAAITTLISEIVVFIILLKIVSNIISTKFILKKFILDIVISLPLLLVNIIVIKNYIVRLFVNCVIIFILYILLVVIFDKNTIKSIKYFIKR